MYCKTPAIVLSKPVPLNIQNISLFKNSARIIALNDYAYPFPHRPPGVEYVAFVPKHTKCSLTFFAMNSLSLSNLKFSDITFLRNTFPRLSIACLYVVLPETLAARHSLYSHQNKIINMKLQLFASYKY